MSLFKAQVQRPASKDIVASWWFWLTNMFICIQMLSKCKETLENEVIWCSDILRGHAWPMAAMGMVIPLKLSWMYFKCISIGNWWFWITVARNFCFWDPQSWPIDLKPRIWAFHIELRRSWNFQINPMSRKKIRSTFQVGGGRYLSPPHLRRSVYSYFKGFISTQDSNERRFIQSIFLNTLGEYFRQINPRRVSSWSWNTLKHFEWSHSYV